MLHMAHYFKRGKWFHFKRRIPKTFQNLYGDQDFVSAALKTDSEVIAKQRAQILNTELEALWQRSLMQEGVDMDAGLQYAVLQARLNGFSYRSAQEIAEQDIGRIVERLISLKDTDQTPDKFAAILGGHNKPEYPISDALRDFFAFELQNMVGKGDEQIRKWKNPRIKGVSNFIQVVGDKDVSNITREDVLAFRTWWHKRIKDEGLTANSANKDFSYVRQTLSFARDDKQVDIDVATLFERIRFTEKQSSRPPFRTDFIKNTLLDLRNLGSLNEECRYFIFAMADTGARVSELVGLDGSNNEIRLDTNVPYIVIQPNGIRTLKTQQSERQIPLTGASLYAFQNLPGGFKHYLGKADLLSSTLNKYLSENGLLPSDGHSVYSLRHSFEDRLTEVETPEKVMASLMGHKYSRERYGKGPSLDLKRQYLDKICFDVN